MVTNDDCDLSDVVVCQFADNVVTLLQTLQLVTLTVLLEYILKISQALHIIVFVKLYYCTVYYVACVCHKETLWESFNEPIRIITCKLDVYNCCISLVEFAIGNCNIT